MKDQLQTVVVRVVASELDRRAKPMEQAIRDLQQRASSIESGGVSLTTEALVPIQHAVASVSASSDRVSARVDTLASRVTGREAAHEQLDDAIRLLRADVQAIQSQLGQLLAIVERLGATTK
jgi:prefoldin subunit 5